MAYDPDFIPGRTVPLPTPSEKVLQQAYEGGYIHHTRHSLLFNIERGFTFVSAHNMDGATLPPKQLTSRRFKNDPLIKPTSLQVDSDRGYRESKKFKFGPNPWDQGHMARRASMSWGDKKEAKLAERESDYWSNITPQHKNLHSDSWGLIEDWMLERVQDGSRRACVFTGPVFTADDPEHKNGPKEKPIRIPAGFWKVITVELEGAMRSAGFLVWQRDYDSEEPLPFNPVLEQVRLTTIEVLTGLTFPALRKFDPLLFDRKTRALSPGIGKARETVRKRLLRGIAAAPRGEVAGIDVEEAVRATAPGTAAVTSPRDIVL